LIKKELYCISMNNLWNFNDVIPFGKYKGLTVYQISTLNTKYVLNIHAKGIIRLHPIVLDILRASNPIEISYEGRKVISSSEVGLSK